VRELPKVYSRHVKQLIVLNEYLRELMMVKETLLKTQFLIGHKLIIFH